MSGEDQEPVDPVHYPPHLVSQRELSARMGLTTRWIYDLTGEGVFTQVEGKKYDLDKSHIAYREYKLAQAAEKRAPSSTDGLNLRKDAILKLRMDRELRELIPITDAMAAVDVITGHFLEVISGLPARITRHIGERKRIEAITDAVRSKLSSLFAAERQALQSGIPVGETIDEDDA